jgi:hypothetical protein
MEELYEACAAMRQGHLSEASIKRISSSLQKRVGLHPAFSEDERQFLRLQLQQVPRAEGAAHFGIRELSARVAADYLKRWGQAVTQGPLPVELFARSVAAYLLDAGFSGQYLHDFIKARLGAPEQITLAELCNALHDEVNAKPPREFEVLLAYTTVPGMPNGVPASWLRAANKTDRRIDRR